ncbi:lipid-A-disaccharide synthase [Halanaerobium congolense]|uniref:Lipid-A-disaccharide synthase n=1 Tax=Halanaerobium congolense TaxID=54121 RepID=A0A1M7LNU9_9FIRM|nr:lipid-A-disaccharide synthase [Halanaerobium congolense]KXS49686.1 MAG: lipid-A-disaccharide synthase [Halanaerobium sp. T82-1]TDP24197.1 lipid-A-disaccharide synthase [Halanaerobium congolense]TDS33992.1 lipid-A-disaccharide synthase [Halanaerobium congolense]TDX45244.1 lipid-A-disaccharide synthase [Halanaerobium congolense]SDH27026.1 lipid-A-disaccharide synthase [Halanaerobium congolense]
MLKIMVSAGEISGDMHAAAVLKKVKGKYPEVEIFGMGSTALKEMGAEILIDPTEISTIGYIEALKNLRQHFKHLSKMKELLRERKPDLVFLVDYSAFNMKLAKACSQAGVKAVNYFPPSAWVYNKKRAAKMASYGTKIAAVFPMEREVYAEAGADVSFVGHPLLDMVSVEAEPEELRKEFKLSDSERLIGLFPGSRRGEIESLLPEMLKAASELKKEKDDLKFLVSAADGIKEEYLQSFVDQSQIKAQIIGESNYKIMKAAEFIITASGTTALESAILNTPQIICYQAAWTSYFLAKYVFKIEFVGLPNIIYGSQIVPELLQNDFEAAKIVEIALEWLNDQNQLNKIKNKLQIVREKLGGGGAVNKTAELLLKEGGLKNSG